MNMVEPFNIIENFKSQILNPLNRLQDREPALKDFIAELEQLDCCKARRLEPDHSPTAVGRHLRQCLGLLGCDQALAEATRQLAGALRWYQIFEAPEDDNSLSSGLSSGLPPGLAAGLVAGQLAGKAGLIISDRITCGLFLLAPGVSYPLHTHGALELYYVLSGTLTLQHGRASAPFALAPGEHSITPSHRLHALRTGGSPCLIFYTWVGDLTAPNWWWEQDTNGDWQRLSWVRGPDARWRPTKSEPVTPAILAEAGEI